MLPEFDLLMPETLREALDMLAEGPSDVTPVAGGTNLLVDMRSGRNRPGVLMDISRLDELGGIREEEGHLVVGGGVTVTEMLDDQLIARHTPVVTEAAAIFANPLLRNRATIGGNLVDASPAADMAPPLLALDAEVELVSKESTRRVPLEDFMVGVRRTLRHPHELLSAVRWRVPPQDSAGAFYKVGLRKADAISVLSVAVRVEGDGGGRCRRARIALGAVASRPMRAHDAENLLQDRRLMPDTIGEAARLSAEATSPIDDIRGTAIYRRRVTEALVRRLLTTVAEDVRRKAGG